MVDDSRHETFVIVGASLAGASGSPTASSAFMPTSRLRFLVVRHFALVRSTASM